MNLFNLIKRTIVSRKTADTGQVPVSQVKWNGKTANIEVIWPYGLAGNLPVDSIVLTFNVMGQEENKAGIGNTPKTRFKNLEAGEVAVGNPVTGSVVKFLENGDIEVTCKNDQNVTITGDSNVTVGGDVNLTITGDVNVTATGNVNVTSPLTTITGALAVTGDITAFSSGSAIAMSAIKSTFNTHTHQEFDVGGQTGQTGTPI